MFSRLSLILLISLCASLVFNYTSYKNLKIKDSLITQQDQSIKDLNKTVKLNESIRDIGDIVFKDVIHLTEESNKSFDGMLSSLPALPQNCKPIIDSHKPIGGTKNEGSIYIDPDVINYYKQLHSAYDLQNKY